VLLVGCHNISIIARGVPLVGSSKHRAAVRQLIFARAYHR
jgi:hypothetical protein